MNFLTCSHFHIFKPRDFVCNFAVSVAVTGTYPVLVFNVGWVGLVCVGVWADDGCAWLVVRVAQSVTHDFNSAEDGISNVLPQLWQLVG